MKFTLKNRPDPHDYYYRKQTAEWFEGFEKEPRRRYKLGVGTGYHYSLKEILGE